MPEPTPAPLGPIAEADLAIDFAANAIAGELDRNPAAVDRLSTLHFLMLEETDRRAVASRARAARADAQRAAMPEPVTGGPRRRGRRARSTNVV